MDICPGQYTEAAKKPEHASRDSLLEHNSTPRVRKRRKVKQKEEKTKDKKKSTMVLGSITLTSIFTSYSDKETLYCIFYFRFLMTL